MKFFRIKRDKKRVEKKDKKITGKRKLNRFKRLPLYVRIIIIIISSIIFIGAVGTAGFFIYIDSMNKAINSLNTTEIENILAPIESPEEPVTILVLGRDTRDAENDAGRADIIMLFYLDPEDNTGSLLSIPRDTLVEIPDHGEDKINAAYAYGGEELMIRTINSFLGTEINHYITLDFEGFVKLIDALGGVDITIDRPIVDPKSGANFASGNHHLTGEQALSYTRSRSTELGDIGRIQRQQQLFKELIEQKLNIKYLSNVPYYFNILVENTRTDLDVLTILRYSKAILSFGSENFGTAIIPSRSDWIKDGTVSVQIPDVQEARAMWQRIINGEPASIFNAEYSEVDEISDSMTINTQYKYKIRVKNTGALSWNKNGDNPIYLGYHWIDFNNKETVVFDGRRSIIPQDGVDVGDEIVFDLVVTSPSEPGEYILQVDLVQESVTWFSFRGVPPLEKFISIDLSYSAQYNDIGETPNFLDTGEEFSAVIEVKNNGFLTWGFTGDERIALGTHWIDRDTGEIVTWDGNRGLLAYDISYGEETEVEVNIKAPDKAGRYILQFDMVHERVTWFSEKGVIPLEVNVDVGRNLYKAVAKNTTVKIYNGNGISGAAGEIKAYLERNGFKVFTISNAETFDFKETTILFNKGSLEKAEQLALIFDNLEIYAYNDNWNFYQTPADLIMIVGEDYRDIMQ